MYIRVGNLFNETKNDTTVDAILQWVSQLFEQIGHFIAQAYDKLSEWFLSVVHSELVVQIGHSIAQAYDKSSEWLLSVVHAANEPLKEHPYIALFLAILIFLGPWILLLPLVLLQAIFFVVLYILGFGLSGIIGGSPAALYQSFCYGGHTPSSSIFAMLQSTGTHYNVVTASDCVLLVIRLVAGMLGLYVLVAIIMT